MEKEEIAQLRLVNQKIAKNTANKPEGVVSSLGAIQAQAYQDALWAVGLRCKGATQSKVEDAIAKKRIIRTWAMRGTWHFVPPNEVRWLLSLYPEEDIIPSYQRRHGLTEPILRKGLSIIPSAFRYRESMSYKELGKALADSGIPELKKIDVQRHIIRRAGRKGIICFNGNIGGKPEFTLLESSVSNQKVLSRDIVLRRLAKVYFESHGPAMVSDFAWWSGVKMADARKGVDAALGLKSEMIGGSEYWMPKQSQQLGRVSEAAYLLPAFDEYLIAYKDRSAIIEERHAKKVINGSTLQFSPMIVFAGSVIGTWKRVVSPNKIELLLKPFDKLDSIQKEAISVAAERYEYFVGKKVVFLRWSKF